MATADPPDVSDRLGALVAEVAADPRPPSRLLSRLQTLDAEATVAAAALGAALFESIHYRLPAFSHDHLPILAARLYARAGREDAAFLLAGLAVQLRPRDEMAQAALATRQVAHAHGTAAASPAIAAKAAAIAGDRDPSQVLLRALEVLDNPPGLAASAAMFEAVWPRVEPIAEYWVYYRMAKVYAALARADATVLLATMAIQMEPSAPDTDVPYRLLFDFFQAAGRTRDAAELCVRRHALCPAPTVVSESALADLLARAGPLHLSPPPAGRRDRPLLPKDVRRPRPWRCYGNGVPVCLQGLQHELVRPPIAIAELQDADVLVNNGAVAVFGRDGAPHPDLSMRCFPPLLRQFLAEQQDGAGAAEEIEIEAAIVISDAHPTANLCHFLLDHISRLELYRRGGVQIGAVTVIGPELRTEYQRVTAERMGIRSYFPVSRRARLRVSRLWVSSNCHNMRHPGHFVAEWAVRPVRAQFDLVPRRPARRLLVSRRDADYRRLRSEQAIANLLDSVGFEVIVPGALSFAQQIAAFRDATHVVGPHGAGLANILWCAPGTHVLEIFHPHSGTSAYAMLNDVLAIDYASVVGRDADSEAPEFNDPTLPREQTVPHSGRDMWLDPNDLERWLVNTDVL